MENLQSFNKDCWYHTVSCEDDCNRCLRFFYIKTLMKNANVPVKQQNPISLDSGAKDYESFVFLNDIKTDINNFINNGENLYICSHNTGNGKTSWALKLMFKYFSNIWDICDITEPQAIFIYVPEFVLALKDFNNPLPKKYLNDIKTIPLVIWDDIGTADISNYDYTQLLTYINARQQAGLSNIYTSNLITLDELSSKIGDKLASRVYNTSEIVELKGKDMR